MDDLPEKGGRLTEELEWRSIFERSRANLSTKFPSDGNGREEFQPAGPEARVSTWNGWSAPRRV